MALCGSADSCCDRRGMGRPVAEKSCFRPVKAGAAGIFRRVMSLYAHIVRGALLSEGSSNLPSARRVVPVVTSRFRSPNWDKFRSAARQELSLSWAPGWWANQCWPCCSWATRPRRSSTLWRPRARSAAATRFAEAMASAGKACAVAAAGTAEQRAPHSSDARMSAWATARVTEPDSTVPSAHAAVSRAGAAWRVTASAVLMTALAAAGVCPQGSPEPPARARVPQPEPRARILERPEPEP